MGKHEAAILSFQVAATIEETAYSANYEHARLELARGEISSALGLFRTAYLENPSVSLRSHIRELEAFEDSL